MLSRMVMWPMTSHDRLTYRLVLCRIYSLCEVTFNEDCLVKTRHLPDQLNHLAERISLNSRSELFQFIVK